MVCMATSTASGNLTLSPRPQLRNSSCEGRQVSALSLKAESLRLQGAVNWKVGEKSTRLFATTITRRKAHHSPSTLVRNEATDGEPKPDLDQGEHDERYSRRESAMLHRREIVWAATGAFSYLSSAGIAQPAVALTDADPVPPTNFPSKDCRPVGINGPVAFQDCCQPDGTKIRPKPFKFENLPMRIRRPAHILSKDPVYVGKYNEAYRRMIALPPDDPRSFRNQWRIHCSFCNGVYPEPGNSSGLALQYHGSWAFLPWHRMYLYFHERILGELINDRSFALPFWNWDNQRKEDGGNQLPRMFVEDWGILNDHLRCAIRDLWHFPPTYINLTDPSAPPDENYETLRTGNLSLLHTAVVSTVSPTAFLGGPYRPNQSAETNIPGTAEQDGHNSVHVWTGGKSNLNDEDKNKKFLSTPNNEDMGTFIYAARDPIFYAHHSNVDRLWWVWQRLDPSSDEATRSRKRRRKEPTDPGFRNTEFAFYDHNKDIVVVKIEDTLDSQRLSFAYEVLDSDKDWINFRKRPSGAPKPSQADIEPFARRDPVISKDQPSSFRLLRRAPTDSEAEGFSADDVEETLLVIGAKLSMNSSTFFKVFVNLPGADATTPLDVQEFAGLISHVPHARIMGGADMSTQVYTLRVSLGAVVKSLNLAEDESVSVTFVPGGGQSEDVAFDNLIVDFV